MSNQGPINPPDLRSVLDQSKNTAFSSINCCQVGIIRSVSGSPYKATIELVNSRAVYNASPVGTAIPADPNIIKYPLLVDVPLFYLFGGGAYFVMPVEAGDPCIVLFNDRDLDPWFTNGTQGSPPQSSRMHSLADGIALVGIRPAVQPPDNVPTDGQHMAIGNDSGTLIAAFNSLFTALIEWVNTDSTTPNPATVAALTSSKARFNSLFQ